MSAFLANRREIPMNRLMILAAASVLLGAGKLTNELMVDPPVNLQASTPGTAQTGHINVSGTVLAGTFFGTSGGTTTKVVSGWATSPTGFVFGGDFRTASVDGRGVFASATSTTGFNYGGDFRSASINGRGIFGYATSTTGQGIGGEFRSDSPNGFGVQGRVLSSQGTPIGVYGEANANGWAGFFQGRANVSSDLVVGGVLSAGSASVSGAASITGNTTVGGTLSAANLIGGGSGITGLDASHISIGTVSPGNLPTTVAYTNSANSFTSPQTVPAGDVNSPGLAIGGSSVGLFASGSALGFSINSLEQMRLTSVGLGINNPLPSKLFHLIGTGGPAAAAVYNSANIDMVLEDSNTTGIQIISDVSSRLIFGNQSNATGFTLGHNVATDNLSIQSGSIQFVNFNGVNNRVGIGPASASPTTTLDVVGTITGTAKNFLIDHPQDPYNATLRHACVESDEYKNVYDGVITTDARGYATITLPSWFDSLNENFRYQLTIIDDGDDFVLAKVTKEIENNRFMIRTSKPSVKVSWMVTGVRKDAYVRDNPLKVEEAKTGDRKGKLLYEPQAGATSKAPARTR